MNGPAELKKHYWFQETNWEGILAMKIDAIYCPSLKGKNMHPSQKEDDAAEVENAKLYEQIMEKEETDNFFKGYYFDCENALKPKGSLKDGES